MEPRRSLAALILAAIFALGGDCFPEQAPNPIVPTNAQRPSEAKPANTPGSPGVVVTNPKLIAQFGKSGARRKEGVAADANVEFSRANYQANSNDPVKLQPEDKQTIDQLLKNLKIGN